MITQKKQVLKVAAHVFISLSIFLLSSNTQAFDEDSRQSIQIHSKNYQPNQSIDGDRLSEDENYNYNRLAKPKEISREDFHKLWVRYQTALKEGRDLEDLSKKTDLIKRSGIDWTNNGKK